MANRLIHDRAGYNDEFINGMDDFIKFACCHQKYLSEKVIRCRCKPCKKYEAPTPNEVNVQVFSKKGLLQDIGIGSLMDTKHPQLI